MKLDLIIITATLLSGALFLIEKCYLAKRRVAAGEGGEAQELSPPWYIDVALSLFPLCLLILLLRWVLNDTIDFELVLVGLTLVSGLVYGLDKAWLAKQRASDARMPWYIDYSRSLFPVFLLVLVLRSFLYEPYRIPSGSLEPSLLVGDFILVNKYDYGLRLPVTQTKLWQNQDPQRGDIMVFRWPKDPAIRFIKRVIGLPGDKISYVNKRVYVNGELAPQEFQRYDMNWDDTMGIIRQARKQENLLGVTHEIYQDPRYPAENFYDITVPEGHYFVMGDNRDHSDDSRYWGFVPDKNIVGKAVLVWFSWNGQDHKVRTERLGMAVP